MLKIRAFDVGFLPFSNIYFLDFSCWVCELMFHFAELILLIRKVLIFVCRSALDDVGLIGLVYYD